MTRFLAALALALVVAYFGVSALYHAKDSIERAAVNRATTE
jgi:hypothetical protein